METTQTPATTAHLAALRRDGELLAAAIAAASPDAPVPTCPGWTLRDLVHHTGKVHRWAASYVVQGHREPVPLDAEAPADAELHDWFVEGHRALVAALAGAPADLECWTFLAAPSPLAFWTRRQAHETAIHRVDAEAAAGLEIAAFEPEFAADGITELTAGLLSREKARIHSDRERTLLVRPTDGPAPWLLRINPGRLVVERAEGPAECELAGSAHDLYLLLWNRLRDETAVKVTGDQSVFAVWRELARV
ncbi:hypothetical protein CFP65_6678 [Kitasatospora sp. MMS16-BH015]|uniref:maleylpyruvate isomerase family mycothiol-dependent enzyme n=1 Tax=Kitasatospora sp. MMS16-BH015 TaxID=2018025 RepID=UPI000CA1EB88|nr:maleylpyruvate isomerase family mycothiol-dependent enzyme [Kitasatospora sp. MMS16-BH015]AUG81323.1 hypothetical protein CFP65_6678 [Kitasatospora sp. MMS16-BH015]